jgi:hypothetical protein
MVTRTARLEGFMTDEYPGSGLQVQVLAEDHVGTYVLPFPCERIGAEWRNGTTGEAVQVRIIGWREFRTRSRGHMSPAQKPTKEWKRPPILL